MDGCYDEDKGFIPPEPHGAVMPHTMKLMPKCSIDLIPDKGNDYPDDLIKTGRLLYRKSDSSADPATETVFDDNFTEQRSWAGIRRCDHKTSSEMTDLFVNLRGNEKTRDHRKNQQKKKIHHKDECHK